MKGKRKKGRRTHAHARPMATRHEQWMVVTQGPTTRVTCRREGDRDGQPLWRVRCASLRYVANPRWHRAGPMPLGARWNGDTRDIARLAETIVREVSVVSSSATEPPSADAIAAALVISDLASKSPKHTGSRS